LTPFTDTHLHLLSMERRGVDLSSLGYFLGMDIGTDPCDMEERKGLLQKFPHLLHSVGAGPWCESLSQSAEEIAESVKEDAISTKAAAIGEIGLDYHRKGYDRERQMEIFSLQLEVASELKLPVVIHSRDADEDTALILSQHKGVAGIMHCFSGRGELMGTALSLGYHISFSGNVTYKGSGVMRENAKSCPIDRLLLETDSPYLSPMPVRGTINTPDNISHTYSFVAGLRGISVDELKEIVQKNFQEAVPRP